MYPTALKWHPLMLSTSAIVGIVLLFLNLSDFGIGAGAGAASSSVAVPVPLHQVPPTAPPPQPSPTPLSIRPILLTDPVSDPKKQGVVWFSPTGHTLRGAFLDYWNRYGGLAQFGYPLSEEFFEPVGEDNKLYQVQYFERNRFELHPENAGTAYEVLLGVLGRDFRTQDPPVSPIASARYFTETGHNLSGKFKDYWDTHGGLFVHGYPITEPVQERSTNGKEYLVQWFERSRFELHPENAGSSYEVLLGVLGVQLTQKKGYPYGWYPPYGHAADFSWLAGKLLYFESIIFARPEAGCAIFSYEADRAPVQLSGPNRQAAEAQLNVDLYATFVVFGHAAHSGELYRECPVEPAPGYIIDYAQGNPAK